MDRGLVKWITSSTILASMCCLPSVVMVMFGLSSVTTAAALSDTLYWGTDGYWWFRPTLLTASAIMVIVGLISYFRRQGVCTFDDVKKDKRRVLNVSLLVITIAFVSYMLFNYVILEILGIAVGLPWEDDAFWN